MDFSKFSEYADKVRGALETTSTVAGAGGYTVGAAIQGYKDGRAGDTSKYRQINDIEIDANVNEKTLSTLKFVAFLAVATVVIVILMKRKK